MRTWSPATPITRLMKALRRVARIAEHHDVAALDRLQPVDELVDENAFLVVERRHHAGAFDLYRLVQEDDDEGRDGKRDDQDRAARRRNDRDAWALEPGTCFGANRILGCRIACSGMLCLLYGSLDRCWRGLPCIYGTHAGYRLDVSRGTMEKYPIKTRTRSCLNAADADCFVSSDFDGFRTLGHFQDQEETRTPALQSGSSGKREKLRRS